MRPQQQNRRMRGRGNNPNNNGGGNRKGPNPLTRNYESNGPDVKIRGSAQQIADKYQTLARDAQSAGDRVMAENYLQHAEHYNRIIAAAQAQAAQQFGSRDQRGDGDDSDEDDRDDFDQPQSGAQQPQQREHQQPQHQTRRPPVDASGPQPVIEGVPAEVALEQENAGGTAGGEEARGDGSPQGDDAAPRRPRRPRRSSRAREAADNDAASGDGEQEPPQAELAAAGE